MKLKFTSILLASLISAGSSCFNSPKTYGIDVEDIIYCAGYCAVGGGILLVGAGMVGVGVLGCRKIKIKHYPKNPQHEYNKLNSYSINIANRVNTPCTAGIEYTVSRFDDYLLSYIDSLGQLDYFRIKSAIKDGSQKEFLHTGCTYYNEVRLMLHHLKKAIKFIESNYFDSYSLDAIANLKDLKHSIKTISKRRYNNYKRFPHDNPKTVVYVHHY